MASTVPHPEPLTPDQLTKLLARARDEQWTQLALVNDFMFEEYTKNLVRAGWPAERVFRLMDGSLLVPGRVAAIASLKSLRKLNLAYNNIGAVGAHLLAVMTNLTELNLEANGIGDDGARSLSSLTCLTALELRINGIGDDGGRALTSLTRLTALKLGYNRIGDDGVHKLTMLTGLTALELEVNRIGNDGIRLLSSLPSLTSLNLGGNRIGTEGARSLASMIGLTSLNLAGNSIGIEGARCLTSLTRLTSLNLTRNSIGDEGARAVASLTGLTELDLGANGLGDDGACALTSLTNVASLHLVGNNIRVDGARALASLTSLTRLNLDCNSIGDDGIRALVPLTRLTWLSVVENGIGDDGARGITKLVNLIHLNLAYNKIGDDGVRGLASLPNLTWLFLMGNKIGDSGSRILASLSRLTSLNLSKCQIQRFPREVFSLPKLETLCLFGNPICNLRPELLGDTQYFNCIPTVRTHFADLESGAEADRELKLIVLGNGRVGKTSIVRFLMNEPFDPDEKTTHAIQLRDWTQNLGGHPVRINIWDFGGQDIYFNTHSLFLKSRAVFLIVWDHATEHLPHYTDEQGRTFDNRLLQYWIDYVRAVSPGSQVIVVQNKCDDGRGIEPPADLQGADHIAFSAKFPEFKGEALIGMIRGAASLTLRHPEASLIGRGRWRVKQTIRGWQDEDNNRPPEEPRQHCLLAHDRFVSLCDEDPGTVSSPELLLRFLHDTGVVYHQPHLFHNQIILDQRWAIEAIYTLLDRGRCYDELRDRGGRFTLSNLARLSWDQQKFSAEEQRLFLSFMESCSICFRVGGDDNERIYLAPQLLPERENLPASVREQLNDRLESVNRIAGIHYRYRHRFLHEGIMQRFMARIGTVFRDTAIYWRDGVLLKTATPRAVAEVVCHHKLDNNPSRGEIVLTVWGDGRAELLTQLRREFEQLHGTEREIEESASLDGTTWVSLDDLNRFEPAGQIPTDSGEPLDLQPFRFLLHRHSDDRLLGPLIPIRPEEEPMTKPRPAIYISYAWGDSHETGPESREDIVERAYQSLKAEGYDIRRDKKDLDYRGSITEFMHEIGRGTCIIVVVSDKSLRSHNCMFELLEIYRNLDFRERICPIILSDAKIHQPEDLLDYVEYWKARYEALEKRLARLGQKYQSSDGIFGEYEKIRDIALDANRLVTILGDMNTSTPTRIEANNFDLLKQAINERLKQLSAEE